MSGEEIDPEIYDGDYAKDYKIWSDLFNKERQSADISFYDKIYFDELVNKIIKKYEK